MMSLNWNNFVTWVFYVLVAFLANRGVGTLDKLEASVNNLNIKLAAVVTKTEGYDTRLEKQDDRIRSLEIKNGYKK